MTRIALGLLLLFAVAPAQAGQDARTKNAKASLVILTPMEITTVALDLESPEGKAFVEWTKPVLNGLEKQFDAEKSSRTIAVQVTVHPDRDGEIDMSGKPALSDADKAAIAKLVDATKLPRSRIVDCCVLMNLDINGGDPDKKKPFDPPLTTPIERRLARFRAASTPERAAIMKRWARTEALPLIAQIASNVEPKFAGVRGVGNALKGIKPDGEIDEMALSEKNPDFWRAMLEMAPGMPMIPATRVSLYAANGKFDAARRIVRTLAAFDRRKSAYNAIISEFTLMSDIFYRDVEARIRRGIALNDAGKFDEALAVYDSVLADYPRSAWAAFERHQTLQAKALTAKSKDLPDWEPTRMAILASDPLYESMAQASNEDQLNDLMLRREIDSLFKDRAKNVEDLLRYADIAVDLNQPGFAAMIYWALASSVRPQQYKNRDLVEDVLYCFEQLGATQIKENFKGDHAAQFARIDAARVKRKLDSPGAKAMKRKGDK